MTDGVINVYKEKGFTSHDVVAKLRGILRMKKIGHTGTLDPDATGVLPVCLGKGTKLCELFTDRSKTYEAVMRLGVVTDTQDSSGKILAQKEVHVTPDELEEILTKFRGSIMQIPPMYSALKVNGKKLYEYAREGITIERKPRPLEIYSLTQGKWEGNTVKLTISCSKGTYIRTLCHDIGEALGCGGCMDSLIRTRVGRFNLEDALTLSQIEALKQENRLLEEILPVEEVFLDLTKVIVPKELDLLVHNGNFFAKEELNIETSKQIRLYDSKEVFIGIYGFDESKNRWKPVKMFY